MTTELKQHFVEILPHLRAFARSLCGNPTLADDLVQETILKAWAAQNSFRADTNFRAWVFTILRNTYYSHLRSRKREREYANGTLPEKAATKPNQEVSIELKDMKRLLTALTAKQREALLLVGASGFTYDEAALISGCAVGTIKSRVNRARNILAELADSNETDSPRQRTAGK